MIGIDIFVTGVGSVAARGVPRPTSARVNKPGVARGHDHRPHRGRGGAVEVVDVVYSDGAYATTCPCPCHSGVIGNYHCWGDCCPNAVVGVSSLPSFDQLKPYFLTDYPATKAELTALYEAYLKSYDGFVANIYSVWHPLTSGATMTALRGARDVATGWWDHGGIEAPMALQLLAGVMGWFNANFVDGNGGVKWDALDKPVNAAVVEGAHEAAAAVVNAAKDAGQYVGDKLKMAWWMTVGLVAGGIATVALLAWAVLRSQTGQAVATHYLTGGRR